MFTISVPSPVFVFFLKHSLYTFNLQFKQIDSAHAHQCGAGRSLLLHHQPGGVCMLQVLRKPSCVLYRLLFEKRPSFYPNISFCFACILKTRCGWSHFHFQCLVFGMLIGVHNPDLPYKNLLQL